MPRQKLYSDTRLRRLRRGVNHCLCAADRLGFFVDEQRALAWVAAQEGRLTQAIAELWAAADTALERGQRCFELIILNDLLRLGEADAAARARDVSDLVEGSLGEAVSLHAQAVVSQRAWTWNEPLRPSPK